MDFLYGELSEADADRFRERLATDAELSAEVEAFQRTREAFKALPVEEPPPAVSAQLLHEAAKRAPARKRAMTVEERPGFWAALVELFQPLARHPAAASLAALLLVGGVAGALYLRGVDSPAHPTAASEAPAPDSVVAAGRNAELDGKDVETEKGAFARLDGLELETKPALGFLDDQNAAEGDEDNDDFRARLAEPEEERALRETTGEAQHWSMNKSDEGRKVTATKRPAEPLANAVSGADPLIVPEAPALEADPKPADKDRGIRDERDQTKTIGGLAGKKGKGEKAETEEKSVARQAPLRKTKEIAAPSRSRTFDADGEDVGGADDAGDFAPQSAQPPPRAGSTSSVRGGGGGSGTAVYKNRKDDQWAKSAQGQLNLVLDRKITKKNRDKVCREAAKRANDILDRNPEYYYVKVEGSKRLQPCSGFVRQEMASRAKKRSGGTPGKANAAKKRSKAAGSSADKAKAAPADEAAAESE